MSRIAIITDIHSNYDALNAVMHDIEKRNVDSLICLGDVVTKYYKPQESLQTIMDNCSNVILGNCDFNVVRQDLRKFSDDFLIGQIKKIDPDFKVYLDKKSISQDKYKILFREILEERYFQLYSTKNIINDNYNFKFKFDWLRGKLNNIQLNYLNELKFKEQLNISQTLINLVHSNPYDLSTTINPLINQNQFQEIKTSHNMLNDTRRLFVDNESTIFGHTHQNSITIKKNGIYQVYDLDSFEQYKDKDIILVKTVIDTKNQFAINVGAVGEPNYLAVNGTNTHNGYLIDKYMSYLILEGDPKTTELEVTFVKIPYSEIFKNVYYDSLDGQITKMYPSSPEDTIYRQESLNKMGVEVDSLEEYEQRGKSK